jgi:hypothetical protein
VWTLDARSLACKSWTLVVAVLLSRVESKARVFVIKEEKATQQTGAIHREEEIRKASGPTTHRSTWWSLEILPLISTAKCPRECYHILPGFISLYTDCVRGWHRANHAAEFTRVCGACGKDDIVRIRLGGGSVDSVQE